MLLGQKIHCELKRLSDDYFKRSMTPEDRRKYKPKFEPTAIYLGSLDYTKAFREESSNVYLKIDNHGNTTFTFFEHALPIYIVDTESHFALTIK